MLKDQNWQEPEKSGGIGHVPQCGFAAIASAAIARGRATTIVVRRRGSAGLSWLRNNLANRRIATSRRSRSSLLLREFVVLLERHA